MLRHFTECPHSTGITVATSHCSDNTDNLKLSRNSNKLGRFEWLSEWLSNSHNYIISRINEWRNVLTHCDHCALGLLFRSQFWRITDYSSCLNFCYLTNFTSNFHLYVILAQLFYVLSLRGNKKRFNSDHRLDSLSLIQDHICWNWLFAFCLW